MAPYYRQARFIVIHHPADDNIEKTLRDHIHPPFTDAPYDFWFEYPGGVMVTGRPLNKRGAHVIPDYDNAKAVNNDTAIGVAFEGNFDDDRPPIEPSAAQIERGAAWVAKLCLEYEIFPYDSQAALLNGQGIVPHRLVSQTACPGRHFMARWQEFMGRVLYYRSLWVDETIVDSGNRLQR